MATAGNEEHTAWTPPYIAWKRLVDLIERLETDRPPRIDRTILTGSNQVRSMILKALASLDLIDDEGSLTDIFVRLIERKEDRAVTVQSILEHFYSEPLKLAKVNGTQQQLLEAFRSYGVSGSTLRKAIGFFLRAAEYAQLPLSPHFKTPPVPRRSPTTKQAAAKVSPPNDPPAEVGPDSATSSLRSRYIEMLMNKADSQEDLDTNLLDRIEGLLEFASPEETE